MSNTEKKDKSMRTILLLGGSAQQVIAIETAKKMGLRTVLCDYLPDNPGQYHADKFYQVSTTDKDAVLKVAEKEKIDGILAYASDPAAPTAAYVAERRNLPTNPYIAVNTLCNKDMFREFLFQHGFNTPKMGKYTNILEVRKDLDQFALPVIIKPVDSSGSKGVTVLNRLEKVEDAINHAFSYSRCKRIIVEEFIERKHPYLIGGDIFVSEGKVILWGLMNCHRDNNVNNLVPIGKSYPSLLQEKDLNEVKVTLQKLITEIGFRFGPMNVELIIDKYDRVFPIDIGPRSGGNMIPDLLGMIFDCDIAEMSVHVAMGQHIGETIKEGTPYYATFNLHSDRDGRFESVEFSTEIEEYIIRKNIYKKPGDQVEYFSNAANALGIVFFKFPDEQTMVQMEENMNKHIKIILQEDR